MFCCLIVAQKQLICSFAGVRKNEACWLFFFVCLPGLLGLGRVREMDTVGMNGGIRRHSLAGGFSPGTSTPSPGEIWGSPPGIERLGTFLPLLFARIRSQQPGFGLGGTFSCGSILLEHKKVPSWNCLSLFLLFCFLRGSDFPRTQEGFFSPRLPLAMLAGTCSWH